VVWPDNGFGLKAETCRDFKQKEFLDQYNSIDLVTVFLVSHWRTKRDAKHKDSTAKLIIPVSSCGIHIWPFCWPAFTSRMGNPV